MPMIRYQSITRMIVVSTLYCATAAAAGLQCPPLQDADRAKLIDYIQKKYKLPPTLHVIISGTDLVGQTCYRKLLFRLDGATSGFPAELFLSPNQRFLSRDLFDSSVDPILEERQKSETLAAGLARGNPPTLGKVTAPVTIAVFSDFQCPYCARLAGLLKEVLPDLGDKTRVLFHYFPLPMHPWARPAAEAAACAQDQANSYFWNVHDFLFENQRELTPDNLTPKLIEYAKTLSGFDEAKFASCLAERKTSPRIQQDLAFGEETGITATPTVFLNGQQTQIVAAEQLRTLVRQINADPRAAAAPVYTQPADKHDGALSPLGPACIRPNE